MTAPVVRPQQIWAHKVETSRRFLVIRVTGGHAHGWDYHQQGATTRDKTQPVDTLTRCYRLVDDTPAHLVAQVQARGEAS